MLDFNKQTARYLAAHPEIKLPATNVGAGEIASQINGTFNGWSGETVVKLVNGQIWQQSEYHYTYHYAFMPNVFIYRSGGGHKMKVDGVEKPVAVTQLK